MRTRIIVILLAVLFALSLRGDTYLIVLADGAKAPDITAMGGQVLQQWSNRRLVELPPAAAEQLQSDARIAYVQRIGSPTHRAQFKAVPNATPPSWSTGVYAYDGSGNIKAMGSDSFGYDRVGRLTTSNVQGHAQAFTFDVYGNLTHLGDATLNVDAKNQLSEWDYDEAGNAIRDSSNRTYSYDPLGMVTAIDMAASDIVEDRRMIYTASDERIVIDEGPATARYRLRDVAAPRLLREWKRTGGGVLEWERDYLYAGPTLVAGEVQVDHDHDPMRHYHLDHLGSIRLVTDGSGELVSRHDYLPFGAEIPPTITEWSNTGKAPRDPLKFTGHERDYFSLANVEGDAIDYMHARFYGAGRGRFLKVDAAPGRAGRPQSWNRYGYASNSPLMRVDPDGNSDNSSVERAANAYLDDKFRSGGESFYAVLLGLAHDDPGLSARGAWNVVLEVAAKLATDTYAVNGDIVSAAKNMLRADLRARPGQSRKDIATDIAMGGDFSTHGRPIVLYSGDRDHVRARITANNIGGMLIEDTPGGRQLRNMELGSAGSDALPIWAAASARFAGQATGEVHVFLQSLSSDRPTLQLVYEIPAVKDPGQFVFH